MKNTFTLLILLISGAFAVTSCDNGNADVVLRDSPPNITLNEAPAVVESGAPLQFSVDLVDGVSPELSSSPLASYGYTMTDTTSGTEVANFTQAITGTMQTVDVNIETGTFEQGVYLVEFTATDQASLTSAQDFYTEVLECPEPAATIGIIGTAADGWDGDVDLTQDATNPYLWTATMDLNDGEAKFRQDNDWAVNWGDSAFPSGTGTQDGDNIAVTPAGEYEITFNTCTGAYSFTGTE